MTGKVETSAGKVVTLDYAALEANEDLTAQIEAAFGFDGLGILCVRNVPGFAELRESLLPLAYKFAKLPDEVKAKSEHAASMYSFGWSHGKEIFNGKADRAKGSYYANPQYDRPVDDDELIKKWPAFIHPNIWPEDLPALGPAFKACGQKMVEVGELVARQCDAYVAAKAPQYKKDKLRSIISTSRCAKGRLLHYFANEESAAKATAEAAEAAAADKKAQVEGEKEESPSWCGWHNDHGSLTALCPGMFMDAQGSKIACPDPTAGLYIRTRQGATVKASVPTDCIAFQIGETAQIHSGGVLQATPHAVMGGEKGLSGFSRESFAVFMEPEWDEPMDVPDGVDPSAAMMGSKAEYLPEGVPLLELRWDPKAEDHSFGDFTSKTLKCYYGDGDSDEKPAEKKPRTEVA